MLIFPFLLEQQDEQEAVLLQLCQASSSTDPVAVVTAGRVQREPVPGLMQLTSRAGAGNAKGLGCCAGAPRGHLSTPGAASPAHLFQGNAKRERRGKWPKAAS